MASLFHLFNVSSFPTKTDRQQRTIPGARPYVSCLGQSEGANNIWGSRCFNPKTRYEQKKHLSEQMPTRVCAHRWPLGRHVLLKIVKRQKQHASDNWSDLFLKTIEIEWVAWRFNQKNSMLGGESILQIQSTSWFTGAQLLACDDDWAMVLGYSCVQNRMRKLPW